MKINNIVHQPSLASKRVPIFGKIFQRNLGRWKIILRQIFLKIILITKNFLCKTSYTFEDKVYVKKIKVNIIFCS